MKVDTDPFEMNTNFVEPMFMSINNMVIIEKAPTTDLLLEKAKITEQVAMTVNMFNTIRKRHNQPVSKIVKVWQRKKWL